MKPSAPLIVATVAAAALLGLGSQPAFAQSRVFVSGTGSDSNPCSLAAPCRSFQQAHNTVVAGGEIVALDAAGYGPLAISKAVTVTAIGIEASITSSSTDPAISINAGAGDVVALRGLTLFAGTSSGNGINIVSAKSVTIRDCSVSGFHADGISVGPSANMDVELNAVSVTNSSDIGLNVAPGGSGKLTMLVTGSTFSGSGSHGIAINASGSTGSVTGTFNITASANGGFGFAASSGTGQARPVLMVTGSKLVNNASLGLRGTGNAQIFVDRTQITGNGTGWEAFSGAVVNSYNNNAVNGNGNDALNGVVQISSE